MKRILQIIPILFAAIACGQTAAQKPALRSRTAQATINSTTDQAYEKEWVRRIQEAIDKSIAQWDKPKGPDTRIIWCRTIPPVKTTGWHFPLFRRRREAVYPEIHCSLYPPINPHEVVVREDGSYAKQ